MACQAGAGLQARDRSGLASASGWGFTARAPGLTRHSYHAKVQTPGRSLGGHARPGPGSHCRAPAAAAAATDVPPTADAQRSERTFDIPGARVRVEVVTRAPCGTQAITVATDKPGSLLLHWGVEGGAGYEGGWRLPGPGARPPRTVQYKQRALQTRFSPAADGGQAVSIELPGPEASDRLNFVIKNEGMGEWYDLNGANFQVQLRDGGGGGAAAPAGDVRPALLPADAVPNLPQELCGVWAYLAWERAGCPARSGAEADAEYDAGVAELVLLLRRGVGLDELWAVARGQVPWAQFQAALGGAVSGEDAAAGRAEGAPSPPAPAPPAPAVPEHLVGTQAYLLWEAAGKPDGADFGADARRVLREQLAAGRSVQELEHALGASPPEASQTASQTGAPPASAPAPAQTSEESGLGASRGMRSVDPLDLIKRPAAAPLLADARPGAQDSPLAPLVRAAGEDDAVCWHRTFNLGDGAQLLATVRRLGDPHAPADDSPELMVELVSDAPDALVLHWGVRARDDGAAWLPPPPGLAAGAGAGLLAGGEAAELAFEGGAAQGSVLSMDGEELPLQRARVPVPVDADLAALAFVLRSRDGSRWWRDGGGDFRVPLPTGDGGGAGEGAPDAASGNPLLQDSVARAIVEAEATPAWTLMHRFNRASDLLEQVAAGGVEDVEGSLARIYVWLRYSSIRQLTWQRNYNTQPRILGAAQERLTHTIAKVYSKTSGMSQEWARLLLTTVGRGGNAQAVRDDILHIMHRNHIPEKGGTWMEQWHQKLHNNTTPDDVPICEAYLAFLESGGDQGTYWRVLADAGVTRQRLESFDRPITVDPQFFGDRRDALLADFRAYLKVLKAVHSGADLQASASAAARIVPAAAKAPLGYALAHAGTGGSALALVEAAVEARTELAAGGALASGREALYLDLALEATARAGAERGAGAAGSAAAALIAPLLQNLALSVADNEEVCHCLKAWLALPAGLRGGGRAARDDALQATAVLDRARRAVAALSDRVVTTLGPLGAALGAAFGAEDWTVRLFAEEVVRAGPAFALSLALSAAEPGLRAAAELGAWQLVSPGAARGELVAVPSLREVQDRAFPRPTVLLAWEVTGEEEVPAGVVALLSPDAPDVLSHLAVRARNLAVLFAACHDAAPLRELEALEGRVLELDSTAAGAVTWQEADEEEVEGGGGRATPAGVAAGTKKLTRPTTPKWCGKWVLGMDEFKQGVVGAKSNNLAGLRGRLPESIQLPASVTIPFGSFEKALESRENRELAKQIRAAVSSVTPHSPGPALARCRDLVNQVAVPSALRKELEAGMRAAGIPVPQNEERWEAALCALKAVWASKYNDRAFYSCRKVGLRFDDVRMAVLCQRVVPVRYAFVIHTANPVSGDADEIYAELVIGLGEAIVSGAVPGSALAFSARKDALDAPRVLLYPSKSRALVVADSLILRSDSNGEDLEGYAGAGLYESVTVDATRSVVADYSADDLLMDPGFRRRLMTDVCRVGLEIEQALGSAQDIEGVVGKDGAITVVQTRPQV